MSGNSYFIFDMYLPSLFSYVLPLSLVLFLMYLKTMQFADSLPQVYFSISNVKKNVTSPDILLFHSSKLLARTDRLLICGAVFWKFFLRQKHRQEWLLDLKGAVEHPELSLLRSSASSGQLFSEVTTVFADASFSYVIFKVNLFIPEVFTSKASCSKIIFQCLVLHLD